MTPIFLDTVGLIAVWDIDDQWHQAADEAYQRILSSRQTVVTTTYILLECGNAAARRVYRENVCALRRVLELRNELIVPSNEDWANAWDTYQRENASRAGIVDCISFSVMRRLGVQQVFTNDRHFREAGFETMF